MAILAHEYINKLLKPIFKIRQRKIALNQTLTLKLGATLVLTVTQVYVFVNLRRVTFPAMLSSLLHLPLLSLVVYMSSFFIFCIVFYICTCMYTCTYKWSCIFTFLFCFVFYVCTCMYIWPWKSSLLAEWSLICH